MAVQKVFCALLLGVTTSLASLPSLVHGDSYQYLF